MCLPVSVLKATWFVGSFDQKIIAPSAMLVAVWLVLTSPSAQLAGAAQVSSNSTWPMLPGSKLIPHVVISVTPNVPPKYEDSYSQS